MKTQIRDIEDEKILFSLDVDYTKRTLDFIINEGQTKMPDRAPNGSHIKWSITSGHAVIKQDTIHKKEEARENEPITLEAKVTKDHQVETVKYTRIVLKDAYTAHVMSYFNHDEGSNSGKNPEAGMRLAYSYDGINWVPLNNGKSVVNEKGGTTNWLRDPHIFRKKDGTFGVAATQGWDTPNIFVWETEDLIHFEEHYLLAAIPGPVSDDPDQNLTGKRAWAPKVMYDTVTDQYYIFWSDPGNPKFLTFTVDDKMDRPLYYNTTTDFTSLSKPEVYFSAGYRIIDASIVKEADKYYMFYKDERKGKKVIKTAISDSLEPGSFKATEIIASNQEEQVEGPFAFRSVADNRWYLYYDDFADKHTYCYSIADDISTENWHTVGVCTTLPIHKLDYKTRISHGGQITVTQAELDRIIKAWRVQPVKLHLLEVAKIKPIEVKVGTAFEALDLPKTVCVKIDDGCYRDLKVVWSAEHYNCIEAGTCTLQGTIEVTEDMDNVNNIKACIDIVIS